MGVKSLFYRISGSEKALKQVVWGTMLYHLTFSQAADIGIYKKVRVVLLLLESLHLLRSELAVVPDVLNAKLY